MKKTLVCVLAVALCILVFAACGGVNVTGRYVSAQGDAYDFNGHGEVPVTVDGETTYGYTYAINGSAVFVYEPDYDHENAGETDNILAVSGETLTDKNSTVFTKEK